jgi:PST family polysaccharide transporter
MAYQRMIERHHDDGCNAAAQGMQVRGRALPRCRVGLASCARTQVGVSAALVQRRDLADDDVSAAFAFSVLVALVSPPRWRWARPRWARWWACPPIRARCRCWRPLPLAGVAAVPSGPCSDGSGSGRCRRRPHRGGTRDDRREACARPRGLRAYALRGSVAAGAVTAAATSAPRQRLLPPGWRWPPPADDRLRVGYLTQLGNWGAVNADNFVVAGMLAPGRSVPRVHLSPTCAVIGGAADKVLFPPPAFATTARATRGYVRSASLIALVAPPRRCCCSARAGGRGAAGAQWTAVVPRCRCSRWCCCRARRPRSPHR